MCLRSEQTILHNEEDIAQNPVLDLFDGKIDVSKQVKRQHQFAVIKFMLYKQTILASFKGREHGTPLDFSFSNQLYDPSSGATGADPRIQLDSK